MNSSQPGIEEVFRFARFQEIKAKDFEDALLRLRRESERVQYQIIVLYFDLCYVALLEERPIPNATDVARYMFTDDVIYVDSVIGNFCQGVGVGS